MKVSFEPLLNIYTEILETAGFNRQNACVGAEVLVTADLWGDMSHGGFILGKLLKGVREGSIDPHSDIEIIKENETSALVDGNSGLGHVIAHKCMQLAIQKAKKSGIGAVGVKRSTHFGCAGYYALMAAREDMIGLAMSNVNPLMTIPGALGRVIGNNPIAYAAPTGAGQPVFLDIAMSRVAGGRIRQADSKGEKIPEGWAVDSSGNWVTDPGRYVQGEAVLVPMADHKGYGLAVMMEIFAGVLTGAAITSGIGVWDKEYAIPADQGHFFIAINIENFMPIAMFKKRMDSLVEYLKNSPRPDGGGEIHVPGEIEARREEEARAEGIILEEYVIEALGKTADELDMKIDFQKGVMRHGI